MTDIHDIKPALAMGPDLQWLYWALAGLALLALLILAWRLWQKRRKTEGSQAPVADLPAHAVAYQLLDALAADRNLEPKQFYFRLSEITRQYIEGRFQIPAAEMTTEELLPRVDRLPLGAGLAQPLKMFCRATDPIKFAGAAADRSRMAHDMAFVRDFVRQTTVAPESAAPAEQNSPPAGPRLAEKPGELPIKSEYP